MNPFKVLATKLIYENPWISVHESQVLNPKGKPGIYGVVKFKNRAVGVVPYEKGQIWLVGQYRFPLEQYSWEIPEGGSPAGEELEATAKRELKEETGLEARSLRPIIEMHLSNSVTNEYGIVYLAEGLTVGQAEPEDTEELKIRKVPLEVAYQEVLSGKITDSLSVAAVLRLMLLKHEGKLNPV